MSTAVILWQFLCASGAEWPTAPPVHLNQQSCTSIYDVFMPGRAGPVFKLDPEWRVKPKHRPGA